MSSPLRERKRKRHSPLFSSSIKASSKSTLTNYSLGLFRLSFGDSWCLLCLDLSDSKS
jgi:hypothetical protein